MVDCHVTVFLAMTVVVDCHVTVFLAMTMVVCLCERSEAIQGHRWWIATSLCSSQRRWWFVFASAAKQSKTTDGGLPRHCVPRNDGGGLSLRAQRSNLRPQMVDCHVTVFLAMTMVVCLCERSEAI